MDIEEAKLAVKRTEDLIHKAVCDLERETGLKVLSINFSGPQYINERLPRVELEVKL